MKTIEFKLYLTRSQQETIDEWLAALKYPWNKSVELIKRFNTFNHYDKRFKTSAPCCPIVSYNHGLRIVNSKNRDKSKEGLRESEYFSTPINWELADWEEGKELVTKKNPCGIYPVRPEQGGLLVTDLTFFSLQPCFTHSRNLDKPWLTAVPSKFIDSVVLLAADAWKAFLSGTRLPPKFKGKNKRIDSLIHNNSKSIRIEGDRINIPKLGWVKAKGLRDRWPKGVPFCPMKICRKASGYYLQLSGEIDSDSASKTKPKPKPKIPSVGLDPGIEHVYCDDADRRVKSPKYLERGMKKLKELQKKAQRQWDANNEKSSDWQRKNWRKTQNKIARIHEKIARRGRAFNHFESTKIVRLFDRIYIEDYKPSEIIKKVEPVKSGQMTVNKHNELITVYEKNDRFLNRASNRAAQRNRVGQLWTMIETKGGDRVVRIERSGTSDECPKCGSRKEKQLRQRIHHCSDCGYVTHRDTAAAQVIKKRGELVQQNTIEKPTQERQSRFKKKKADSE